MAEDRKFYENIADVIGQANISSTAPSSGGWRISRKFALHFLRTAGISVAVAFFFLYAGDYVLFRYKVTTNRNAFGTVTIDRFYSIAEKANRTEFDYAGSDTQPCVHTLFPHAGDNPCWYANRHREQRVEE
jgi:hypothetical protein